MSREVDSRVMLTGGEAGYLPHRLCSRLAAPWMLRRETLRLLLAEMAMNQGRWMMRRALFIGLAGLSIAAGVVLIRSIGVPEVLVSWVTNS